VARGLEWGTSLGEWGVVVEARHGTSMKMGWNTKTSHDTKMRHAARYEDGARGAVQRQDERQGQGAR
jgi:hypothetical protein